VGGSAARRRGHANQGRRPAATCMPVWHLLYCYKLLRSFCLVGGRVRCRSQYSLQINRDTMIHYNCMFPCTKYSIAFGTTQYWSLFGLSEQDLRPFCHDWCLYLPTECGRHIASTSTPFFSQNLSILMCSFPSEWMALHDRTETFATMCALNRDHCAYRYPSSSAGQSLLMPDDDDDERDDPTACVNAYIHGNVHV
jgi:hypothetical protein